jgi:WD40 repeat protein
MRSVLLILATALVVLPAVPSPLTASSAAQTEDAPYLYYYSDILKAFVIERADGTDSRTLATNVMPENYNYVSGPGWSPSGKWFAWTGASLEGGGTTTSSVWVISADGTRRFNGLEEVRLGEYGGLSWSPFGDKLLVVDDMQLWDQSGDDVYSLVDVDAGQIVATFQTKSDWRVCGSIWSPDGYYKMFYHFRSSTNDEIQTFLRTVSPTGDVRDRKLDGIPVMLTYFCPTVSKAGWFLYHTSDGTKLIGENLLSGEHIELDPLPDVVMLDWSPGGSYGLLWQESTETLWLLSVSENKMFPVAEHIPYDSYGPTNRWSPTQDKVAFWAKEGEVRLLDAVTHQVTTIIEGAENAQFYWHDDGRTLIIETEQKVSLYDAESQTIRVVPGLSLGLNKRTTLSPDTHYLGLTGDVGIPSLLDTTTGQLTTFVPFSGAPRWRVEEYLWHPDGEWLFTAETIAFAGGGGGPEGVSVLKVDGSLRRELTVLEISPTGVNWLPDRVISYLAPGSPTSVIQQPLMTLEHAGDVNGVAWSPDGTRLASNAPNEQGEAALHLWTVDQTTASQISSFPIEPCGGVPVPCLLEWSPDGHLIGAVMSEAVSIWDATTGERVRTADHPWLPSASNISSRDIMDYSPDGSLVAQFLQGKGTEVRDTHSDRLILDLPDIRAERILWADNGQYLALVDLGTGLSLWQMPSGQQINLDPAGGAYIWDIAFSPDGKLLARASWWDKIAIWDTASGSLLTRLNWYAKTIDFSPDSSRLAAAGSQAVTIWDVTDLNK